MYSNVVVIRLHRHEASHRVGGVNICHNSIAITTQNHHFILQYHSIRLKQYHPTTTKQTTMPPQKSSRAERLPFRTFPTTTTFSERKKRSRDLVHVEHEPTKKRVKIHKKTTSIFDGVDPCTVTTSTLVFPFTDVVAAFIAGKQKRSNDDDGVVNPLSPPLAPRPSALPIVVPTTTTTTTSDNGKLSLDLPLVSLIYTSFDLHFI